MCSVPLSHVNWCKARGGTWMKMENSSRKECSILGNWIKQGVRFLPANVSNYVVYMWLL